MDPKGHDVATLLQAKPGAPTAESAAFVLVVVDGPDKGTEFRIDGTQPSRVLIGQSSACEIRLSDRQVSRRHAAIDPTARGLRLTDLDSSNGTWVGELLVADVCLRGGEYVRLGQTTIHVALTEPLTKRPLTPAMRFGRLVGGSSEMRRLYPLCERLAKSDIPVVVEGETGTGKELLSEAIHEESARANGPFIVFDCTAVPATLLESHLFGHERGAFTGAVATRKGVFEQAHGGTLLIDEIGELDTALQSKLLRALERSEVQRVGAERFMRVDVRVIAATRRDLDREVQAGRFRDDLFYRLAVARIELPPLRRRKGDVTVLARHFWQQLGGAKIPMPADLLNRFEEYTWPGNVRELHNAVARHLALGDLAPTTGLSATPASDDSAEPTEAVILDEAVLKLPYPAARQRVLEAFERRYIERVLAAHNGNVVRAAAASGIARRYFYVIRTRREK